MMIKWLKNGQKFPIDCRFREYNFSINMGLIHETHIKTPVIGAINFPFVFKGKKKNCFLVGAKWILESSALQ